MSSEFSKFKVEIKEENVLGNDYLVAKGRLKGALQQLTEPTVEEDSWDDESSRRKMSARKRKAEKHAHPPFRHTYVMKLFDRSVDLARFEEDTPLYPICRAWMANQPRNPQHVVKRRVSSPEPEPWKDNGMLDVHRLPHPVNPCESRCPSPLPEQAERTKDSISLNYDESPPVSKDELIKGHLQRWARVKKKWLETSQRNEERYVHSIQILEAMYHK